MLDIALQVRLHTPRFALNYRLLLLTILFTVLVSAQQPMGELRLEIKDPSGAPLDASGRLETVSTGVDRSFQADGQGKAVIRDLPLARHRLEVSKPGLATQGVLL